MDKRNNLQDTYNRIEDIDASTVASVISGLHNFENLYRSVSTLMDATLKTSEHVKHSLLADLSYNSDTVSEDIELDNKNLLMLVGMSDLHDEVLRVCKAELANGDYFHAVGEAIKGILSRIRGLTGLDLDGAKLVEQALTYKNRTPHIALNQLSTLSQRNVQDGLRSLLVGLVTMYRNPLAHEPRVEWSLSKMEAVTVLMQISEAHRRIDSRHIP